MIFNATFSSSGSTQFLNSGSFKINNLIILICILYFTTVGECSTTFTYKLPGYICSKMGTKII